MILRYTISTKYKKKIITLVTSKYKLCYINIKKLLMVSPKFPVNKVKKPDRKEANNLILKMDKRLKQAFHNREYLESVGIRKGVKLITKQGK